MPEVHLRPHAEKDLRPIGPGPERKRILAGLARLADDDQALDVKVLVGAAGWRRLRIGTYRLCYRSASIHRPGLRERRVVIAEVPSELGR